MSVQVYSVEEAFSILLKNKITTNKGSVKRWLRQGKLIGEKGGGSNKNSWVIKDVDLRFFIKDRLPEGLSLSTNLLATEYSNVSNETMETYREEGRVEMWQQITSRNIWEGRYEFNKQFIHECMDQLRIENLKLRDYLVENIMSHKQGYTNSGVSFLLEKFHFNGKRLNFYRQYGSLEEQITFAVIDFLREQY